MLRRNCQRRSYYTSFGTVKVALELNVVKFPEAKKVLLHRSFSAGLIERSFASPTDPSNCRQLARPHETLASLHFVALTFLTLSNTTHNFQIRSIH